MKLQFLAANSDAGISASATFSWSVVELSLNQPLNRYNLVGDAVDMSVQTAYAGSGTLSFTASGLPTGLSIDASTGEITGTVAAGASTDSPYSVSVTVSDGTYSDSKAFTWTVSQVLLANPGSQQSYDGQTVTLAIKSRGIPGDGLAFTATGLPAGISINASTGAITGTVARGDAAAGPYTVSITATDTVTGASVTQQFQWSVDIRPFQPPLPPLAPYVPLTRAPGQSAQAYMLAELANAQGALETAEAAATFLNGLAAENLATMSAIVALNPTTYMSSDRFQTALRNYRIQVLSAAQQEERVQEMEGYLQRFWAVIRFFGYRFS